MKILQLIDFHYKNEFCCLILLFDRSWFKIKNFSRITVWLRLQKFNFTYQTVDMEQFLNDSGLKRWFYLFIFLFAIILPTCFAKLCCPYQGWIFIFILFTSVVVFFIYLFFLFIAFKLFSWLIFYYYFYFIFFSLILLFYILYSKNFISA